MQPNSNPTVTKNSKKGLSSIFELGLVKNKRNDLCHLTKIKILNAWKPTEVLISFDLIFDLLDKYDIHFFFVYVKFNKLKFDPIL